MTGTRCPSPRPIAPLLVGALALAPLAAACRPETPPVGVSPRKAAPSPGDGPSPPEAADTGAAPAPPPRPPEPSRFVELPVPGFEPAVVWLPAASRPLPLVVAAHGAGDGPEWQCRVWRALVGERAVVLCPAGKPFGGGYDGYFFPDHFVLEKIVLAALEALHDAHGDAVEDGPAVYAAYSQGATMGAHMILPHAGTFRRLILIEGGFKEWNVPRARKLREAGGLRVLFACGTAGCTRHAERSAGWLERAGVDARVVSAPRAGHTYGGEVAAGVEEALPWLLEGDARWE